MSRRDPPVTLAEVDAYAARRGMTPMAGRIMRARAGGLSWSAIGDDLGFSADRVRQSGQKIERRILRHREPRTPYNVTRDEIDARHGTAGMNAWRALSDATGITTRDEARELLAADPVHEVPGLGSRQRSLLREWVGLPSASEIRRAALAAIPAEPLPDGVVALRHEEVVRVREYWSCMDDEHRHTTRNAAERCVRARLKRASVSPAAQFLE